MTTGEQRALFPGGVGISALRVYSWPTATGLKGGTPHMRLTCSEGYVVEAGHGSVQTLGAAEIQETVLGPGDIVWFNPGTVHRLITADDELWINVTMQDAGLPEAGDAVLTLSPDLLTDRATYEQAVFLIDPATGQPERPLALLSTCEPLHSSRLQSVMGLLMCQISLRALSFVRWRVCRLPVEDLAESSCQWTRL